MKKVTTNGTVTPHHRYIYRGYLQIACCDLKRSEDAGSSDSDSSGNSSTSGNEQAGQSKPLVPFPEGIDGPDPHGDGTVYSDNDDPATKEPYRSTTSCCQEDMAIKEYFDGLNGQSANYALCGQNCRDFSEATFNHCVNNFKDKCK